MRMYSNLLVFLCLFLGNRSVVILDNFIRFKDTSIVDFKSFSNSLLFDNKLSNNQWSTKEFKNYSFKLPHDFLYLENMSNNNSNVYLNNNLKIGLTLDAGKIPPDYIGTSIHDIIVSTNEFVLNQTNEQKKNFKDFKVLEYKFHSLANKESFLIIQSSTDVSGDNTKMTLKTHFFVSGTYLSSITFTYPFHSESAERLVNDIEKTFIF